LVDIKKSYQALHEDRIFIGSAADSEEMVNREQCTVIIDLRAEAPGPPKASGKARTVRVPLVDDLQIAGQEETIQQAIGEVLEAYRAGHKVGIHCAAGRARTGTVAAGVLLSLGLSSDVDEAEERVKTIRESVQINPVQKQALHKLYPNHH
jgi:predicted protein tyrosine phosphatase